MKTLRHLIIALALCVGSLAGQDLSWLENTDKYIAHGLENAVNISSYVGTNIPTDTNMGAYVPLLSSTEEGINQTLLGLGQRLEVVNPLDPVYTSVYLYDKDGNPLFGGWNTFYLVSVKGGWERPADYGRVDLERFDMVIPDIVADFAMVTFLDANGRSQSSNWLRVVNHQVVFPWQLRGRDAILSVLTAEGWKHWDLQNAYSPIVSNIFPIELSAHVNGVRSFTDAANVDVIVTTQNGVGQSVLIDYTATKEVWVYVVMGTSEGKYAQDINVHKYGVPGWPHVASKSGIGFWLHLNPGRYLISADWGRALKEPDVTWYPPSPDNEKGSVDTGGSTS